MVFSLSLVRSKLAICVFHLYESFTRPCSFQGCNCVVFVFALLHTDLRFTANRPSQIKGLSGCNGNAGPSRESIGSNGSRRTPLRYRSSGTLLEVAITTPLVLQNHDRTSMMRPAEDPSKSWVSSM